jgi:mRNA interferase MazF
MALRPGALVTVSFPFTDLTAVKRRPALVLISHGEDLVVCGVTSKLSRGADVVRLDETGMDEGRLPRRSEIRPLKIFTVHRALVRKIVGRVSLEVLGRVVAVLVEALESGGQPATR